MIKVPSVITRVTTTKDKGLRLTVETQEITNVDKAEVMNLVDKYGVFVFAETDIVEKDLTELPEVKVESWEKSPAQRIRAILYKIWERTDKKKTADNFYKDYMGKLADNLKEKHLN